MTYASLPAIDLSSGQVESLERTFGDLIAALGRYSGLDVRPLREFTLPIPPGCRRVGLRCDVAGDPAWTLPLARLAARYAVPTTFFVNHREPYFETSAWLDSLLVAGPEIGLKVIAWRRDDPAPHLAGQAIAAAIARLRDGFVDLRGLAFDPPAPGIAAESFEIFRGMGLAGRNEVRLGNGAILPLQTLDLSALGIDYTTRFGQPAPATAEHVQSYFDLTSTSDYGSTALRQAYWGNNPLWEHQGITTIALSAGGAWVRYQGNTGDYPESHWDIAALVDWIAGTEPGGSFVFVVDPRLLVA